MQRPCDRVTLVTSFKAETMGELESDINRAKKGPQNLFYKIEFKDMSRARWLRWLNGNSHT